MLTPNEQKVLELIAQDPFCSQQQLADAMGLTRSTIASIVSSLMTKRQLLGRAYVLNTQPTVFCIGGMNVDRKFRLQGPLQLETSNPASSEWSVGGVVRNVAENLGRLGLNVQLLSVAGADQDYEWIKQQTQPFVDLSQVTTFKDATTSTYSAILDQAGDMQLALADMAVCDRMDVSWIQSFNARLRQVEYIVIDLNLPAETVAYLIDFAQQYEVPLAVVPVSAPKMAHLPTQLHGVDWLVVNEAESQAYFGETLPLADYVERWLAAGVAHVLVTDGTRPSYYGDQAGQRYQAQPPLADVVRDVTGAGDSFAAGLIYAILADEPVETAIRYGMTNAYHTVQAEQTVRLNLSAERLTQEYKELTESGKFQ